MLRVLRFGIDTGHRAYRRAQALRALLTLRLRAHSARRLRGAATARGGVDVDTASPALGVVDAQRVCIAGVVWWIPGDSRRDGSLSDRLVRRVLPIDELLQTRPFIRKGAMVDVGANVGTTAITRLLLGHVDYVYAIEPDPANYACLVRTARDNHLVDRMCMDNVALGTSDGQATLLRADGIGRHRLLTEPSRHRGARVSVTSMSLDSWGDWRGCDPSRVTYVKCDTQGWEARILRGASRWLSYKHMTWELEICPRLLEKAGSSLPDLCGLLKDHFQWFVELRDARWNLTKMSTGDLIPVVQRALDKPRNYTNVILGNQ
jgi:FkbM family methyltransferase